MNSLLSVELEYLLEDALNSSNNFNSRIKTLDLIGSLLDKASIEDIYLSLNTPLPMNAEKLSTRELESIRKIYEFGRVISRLNNILQKEQTESYNEFLFQKRNLDLLIEDCAVKIRALQAYLSSSSRVLSLVGNVKTNWLSFTNVVDSSFNGMLLPIESTRKLNAESITVIETPNGVVGDPENIERLIDNSKLESLSDGKLTTVLSFSNAGKEDCSGFLLFKFSRPEIVNCIDITLSEEAFENVVILKAIRYGLTEQALTRVEIEKEIKGNAKVVLNPVEAKYIEVEISSKGFGLIRTAGSVSKKRAIFSIKDMSLYSIKFLNEGNAISKELPVSLPAELFLRGSKESFFEKTNLDAFNVRFYLKNLDTWTAVNFLEDNVNDFVELNQSNTSLKLEIEKAKDFSLLANLSGEPEKNAIEIAIRDPYISEPNSFRLGSQAELAGVVQSINAEYNDLLVRISDSYTFGEYRIFRLPYEELPHLEGRIRVFFNGVEYFESPNPSPSEREYSLSSRGSQIVLFVLNDTDVTSSITNSSAEIMLVKEKVQAELKEDYVILKPYFPIVPIKESTRVSQLSDPLRATYLIRAGQSTVRLRTRNVKPGSIRVTPVDGSIEEDVYIERPYFPGQVYEGNQLAIDYKVGNFYFTRPLLVDCFLAYEYQPEEEIANIEMLLSSRGIVEALQMPLESLRVTDYRESLLDVVAFNSRALQSGSVIKGTVSIEYPDTDLKFIEIAYIDGYTEFQSRTRTTISLERQPYLGSKYRLSLGLEFNPANRIYVSSSRYPGGYERNTTSEASLTDGQFYYDEGNASIYIKTSFTEGEVFSVTGTLKSLDNLIYYSVNYREGELFFGDVFPSLGFVNYKCSNLYLQYEAGSYVDSRLNSDTVVVGLGNLKQDREVYITYNPRKESNLQKLKDYYSPVLKEVVLGF
jgi:hypothetical protein